MAGGGEAASAPAESSSTGQASRGRLAGAPPAGKPVGKPVEVKARTLVLGGTAHSTGGTRAGRGRPAGAPLGVPQAQGAGGAGQPRTVRASATGTPFSAIGVTWQRDRALGEVRVAVRTRASETAPWSEWTTTDAAEPYATSGDGTGRDGVRDGAHLLWTGPARAAEVVVTSVSGRQPVDVRADLIDPGRAPVDAAAARLPGAEPAAEPPTGSSTGPTVGGGVSGGVSGGVGMGLVPAGSQARPVARSAALPAVAGPRPVRYGNGVVRIYSRAAWGANPAYLTWAPEYAPKVSAVALHHTATSNSYGPGDVPAIIRSIYYYMAVSEKYGDIGYNVLVDKFGRAWEGRAGGLNRAVIGAHAGGFNTGTSGIALIGDHSRKRVSGAAGETVARYTAFKLATNNVSPVSTPMITGGPSSKHRSRVRTRLHALFPHRDTSRTACPGRAGLAVLNWARGRARDLARAYHLTDPRAVRPVTTESDGATGPTGSDVDVVPAGPTPPDAATAPTGSDAATDVDVGTVDTDTDTAPTGPDAGVAPRAVGPSGPAATPTGGWTTVPSTGLSIHGAGSGHGRGMSQYGAQTAAGQGLSAAEILRFYYPGTTLTQAGDPTVRVRLSAIDGGHFSFLPVAGAAEVSGLVATAGSGERVRLPARAAYHVARRGDGFVIEEPAPPGTGSPWRAVRTLTAPVTFSGPDRLHLHHSRAKTDCKRGADLTFGGTVRAVISGGTPHYLARMPMDRYLRGVVASEMPAGWRDSALRAQAIAARTYATSQLNPEQFYDVFDTQADQCWDGEASEHPATTAAVTHTAGRILTHGGEPINAQYSADNGGWTASGDAPYLIAKQDTYSATSGSKYTNWTRTLSETALAAADGPAGLVRVTRIRIADRSGEGRWGGRVGAVELTGQDRAGRTATTTVTGSRFRSRLGLRSTYFGLAP